MKPMSMSAVFPLSQRRNQPPRVCTVHATVAAALWVLALAACGGDSAPTEAAAAAATANADMTSVQSARVVPPLLDDEGRPAAGDPRAKPVDAAAWTHSGQYASADQAAMLAAALGEEALQVEVECCSAEAIDRAVGITWGLQASHGLPQSTLVLVRGADLRLAAAAANRLAAGGLTHVFLVTP
jgi:hypothetical protein